MEEELDINEALGLGEAEVIAEPEAKEQVDKPEFSEVEQAAMDQGWSKDRYEEDPSNSRSAKDYIEWGDLKSQIRNMSGQISGMKKSHSEDMANLNIFNKAQTDRQLTALKSELEKAVEKGDIDEVNKINDQQLNIAKQTNIEPTQAHAVDETELMEQWYDDNPWFFDDSDPKKGFANNAYNRATRQGLTGNERLEFVNSSVDSKFSAQKPNVNANRHKASDFSSSAGAPNSRERKLTMADVSPQDMGLREVFETDEAFLKALQNSNKGV